MSRDTNDDAQRDLEQRALRNVRGLLDKMEDEERFDRRTTAKLAVVCGVAVLALVAVVVLYLAPRASAPPTAIVIPAPAKNTK